MCQIARLFLLQRLKGNTWGDARDFNNIETRAVIKFFFFLQGKAPKEIHAILTETLEEHAQSYATVKNWVAQFKRGDFSTCDASRPGRLKTVTTPEIIDQIHELILEDRRISAKSIAEQLGISRERIESIIHAWTRIKNVKGASRLSNFWNFLCRRDPNDFLSGLVTMDETWLYRYGPETKQQSMEWQHSGSPPPKKFRVQKSAGKVLASIFWVQEGILLIDYLPKGQTINAEYYSSLLVQLKDILKEKRRQKVIKGVLFLHDNAPAHRALATQKKLAYLGFKMSWSPTLFSGSGPVGLPPVLWTKK